MKNLICMILLNAFVALPVAANEFPVPQKDLDLWGFLSTSEPTSPQPGDNTFANAKVVYQPVRLVEATDEYVLVQECYSSVELAKQRISSIPKFSQAAKTGGIYEKGFNIQECAYIVNAPKKSMVNTLRYTVYPLFFAYMAGRQDFLYYVTSASGANLRKSASTDSEIKSKMPANSVVYIINDLGDWKTAVTIKGSGFMSSDLLKKIYP